jgi:PIN domain nuclease of toxin-antitoxin system
LTYVLDASAMIALFNNEPGANVVSAILASTGATVYAHGVNLCEFAYWAMGKGRPKQD